MGNVSFEIFFLFHFIVGSIQVFFVVDIFERGIKAMDLFSLPGKPARGHFTLISKGNFIESYSENPQSEEILG